MSQPPIELKGSSFTLSVVHLNLDDPKIIRNALLNKIAEAPAFLKNAPVVINIAKLNTPIDWSSIQRAIDETGLKIIGVSGCKNADLRSVIQAAGLPVLNEGKTANQALSFSTTLPDPSTSSILKARIVTTPVRSGQKIYAKQTDLIVTNNVSTGAELVADGNIHVYGMMRGRALAGANGFQDAHIFCTQLAAELVSIAGSYWLMDQIPADYYGKSATLSLLAGVLTIAALD